MELPVIQFIRETLEEADAQFETREGTAFYDLFVRPQQLMLQPIAAAFDAFLISQSIRKILAQDDPDAFDEDAVDDLVANLFVTRDGGALSTTTTRVFYSSPRDKEFPALTAEFTAGTLSYFNSEDVRITQAETALQTDGTLFYVDVPTRAAAEGDEYNATEAGTITGFVNDLEASRVTNTTPISGGLPRETNTQVLTRAQKSIGVRDLETIKGINAILREKFPSIREIQAIGFGDAEMMRDIIYNAHVGGKTDVYIKTPALVEKTADFIGMGFDETREVPRNYHIQMARSQGDTELPSDLETPNIVVGTVFVREDKIETAAEILSIPVPPIVGVDLSANEWIRIQINNSAIKQIKLSGANPSATQLFEMINSINAAFGVDYASPAPGNKLKITSPTIGEGSQIILYAPVSPILSSNNAADVLFGTSIYPVTFEGDAAFTYVEGVDYEVNYVDGEIYQTSYDGLVRTGAQTILSGQTLISSDTDGKILMPGLEFQFVSTVTNKFLDEPLIHVRPGDEVTIEQINGVTTGTVLGNLPQTFIVSEVVDNETLLLLNFNPSGVPSGPNTVQYTIKSNQVVIIDYKFHPISIDIGPKVLLADGFNRGIRPGRANFTIQDMAFINILSIAEIDPDSLEVISDPLIPPGGFGFGGFGDGGFGVGEAGDFEFIVNSAVDRFSVFEDSIILLRPASIGRSYRVTFNSSPEISSIHSVTRDDLERVTGADVLAKHFVPAFVDMTLQVQRDPTNLDTPSNEDLAVIVKDLVNETLSSDGLEASEITRRLEDLGIKRVKIPFTMTATTQNTDGSTSVFESEDLLIFPEVTLGRDVQNFVTRRIVHLLPGNIVVEDIA